MDIETVEISARLARRLLDRVEVAHHAKSEFSKRCHADPAFLELCPECQDEKELLLAIRQMWDKKEGPNVWHQKNLL